MIRKADSSSLGMLAGFGGGLVGVAAIWMSSLAANPQMLVNAQAEAIQRLSQWASDSINTVFDAIPEELNAWRGVRWYDQETSGSWTTDTPQSAPKRVVVLIHGLDEPGGVWDQLAPALSDADYSVVRFDYPNDQRISLSALSFAEQMETLGLLGVEHIDIVAHSMGGLVVREALTNPQMISDEIPSVHRLITLGTPHLGSPWSRMRAVAEIREQTQRWIESSDHDPKRLLGFARDGVGQAGTDLLPGSEFLEALNARPTPEGIQVTCVVGRAVPFRMNDARVMVGSGMLEQLVGKRDANAIERGIDTLKTELGDGVVPVSSAQMPGATDIVIVDANHRSMIRAIEFDQAVKRLRGVPEGPPPPGIAIVLDRLKETTPESSP
jgi:pimeloyl-ACP methyl ester carboxylesterase